jgi:aspartate/methionine/tyrosine aminotransferase
VTVSRRAYLPDTLNELAHLREQFRARGVAVTDLSDSNPTNHGLFDEKLLHVVAEATRHATHYQPHPRGSLPAREALAARFGGSPDEYWLTASTSEAYNWLFTLLADPGGLVALPTPGYPLIDPLAKLAGLGTVEYRAIYLHPHGWEYDLDSVATAATAAQAFTVVNPNNPTGGYVDEAAATAIATILAKTRTPLIADEVFFPFTLDDELFAPNDKPETPANLAGTEAAAFEHLPPRQAQPLKPTRLAAAEGIVTFSLDGLSKLLAAPGLKLGWIRLTGPAVLTREYARGLDLIADSYLAVGSPIALALPALLDHADATVTRINARLAANLASARNLFSESDGFRVRRSAGGWMTLVDTPPLAPGIELAHAVMRRGRLAVHPGWFYDLDSPRTLALSLLPEPTSFAANCRTLKKVIELIE